MHEAAFTQLYRDHVDFVWRLARSLGIEALHVDDVAHEVFLVARRRFSTRDASIPIKAWLARITRHVALHHHRGRVREARRMERVAVPPPPRRPDEQLELTVAADLVQVFLDRLAPEHREVFVLVEIEGLTGPQAAEICGAKLATVYSRLRAARLAFARFADDVQGADAESQCGGRHAR